MPSLLRPHLARQETAPIKRWVMLGLVMLSLLTTQWLGLAHQIEHQEFKPSVTHEARTSCEKHNHSLFAFLGHEESSVECQLFDAITLAGLITSSPIQYVVPNGFSQFVFGFVTQVSASRTHEPYQSRAPPLNTL
ncbi:hypothetical protein [Polynucleobacter sp. HIN5]|uniref:hypothetical protein n=1 Tax=Polynucleobacter sp. HIN5 TaxID=3047864 RepID=UPI002572612B|nr:hypothetical protein [Polynucleobacter sp. HIN5]BEI33838.1 hypothetical protein PHIN5_12060 [Polynucleobacter sp. HIN5]